MHLAIVEAVGTAAALRDAGAAHRGVPRWLTPPGPRLPLQHTHSLFSMILESAPPLNRLGCGQEPLLVVVTAGGEPVGEAVKATSMM